MGATSALILDFWGGGPAMVQILGCGMDTIMGHDHKRLPSRILAYSPQEDISSFFTLLASLYPNRFSTLGFLQATLFSSSMSCYPKGLTDSNLGYVVSWFLSLFVSRFLSWFCLLVSLFVCFAPKEKLEASGGASVRATSVKLLLVSLPLAGYVVFLQYVLLSQRTHRQ